MRRTAPGPQLLAKQTDLKFGDTKEFIPCLWYYVFGIFGASLVSLTQLIETLGAQ